MKSKAMLVALVIGLFFLLVNPAFASNLLTNAGFEQGIVTGWTQNGPNWVGENTVVHSGALAAQNTIGTISGQDYFASLSQEQPLSAGQTIYATLQTKTNIDPRSSAAAGLLIEFYNGSTRLSYKQSEVGGQADWRNLYVSDTAPSGTTKVKFSAFVWASQAESQPGGIAVGGKAYFDEAVLSTDFIAAPATQTNLANAGFENGLHDWNLIYSPALTVDNVIKQEGNYSVKGTIPSHPGLDFFASASQDLQYLGGKLYGSAYIKTNLNIGNSIVGLLFEYYNQFNPPAGSRIGFDQQTLQGVNDWTRILINGVTPTAGTVMVRVHVFMYDTLNGNGAGGTANFDNVVFSYGPLVPVDFRTTLLNPGFENGTDSWSDQYGLPTSAVSSVKHSGTYSVKKSIAVLTPAQDYYSQVYQDIYFNSSGATYPTNTSVYATAYVKTVMNPITKSKAGLQFEFIDSQGLVIKDGHGDPIVANSSVGGNTDWRYLYVNAQTPAGTVRVRVSGFIFARQQDASLLGDAYFDDFRFSLSPLGPPLAPQNLLNAGFENGLNDWDELNSPGEVNASIKHSGNYAAFFIVDNSPTLGLDYFGSASQDIYTREGNNISAKVWVKTNFDPLGNASAGISLIFLDRYNQQIGSEISNAVGVQPSWTQLSVSGSSPAGTRKVRVNCFLFSPGTIGIPGDKAYFDDAFLSITRTGGPPIKYPIVNSDEPPDNP